jgi:hypothetical protein
VIIAGGLGLLAVTVELVDAIDADGVNNVATYHSGSPQITQAGAQNAVQQG